MGTSVVRQKHLFETKIYYYEAQFIKGKLQLAYYCQSLGVKRGVYLVFCPACVMYSTQVVEQKKEIKGVEIVTYLIDYDETKW